MENVVGLLSNVVACVYMVGWNPVSANEWHAPNGDVWSLSTTPEVKVYLMHMVRSMQDSAMEEAWAKAATHFHGAGLQNGMHFAYSMQYMNSLRKESAFDKAAALETIMVSACWSPERKFAANLIPAHENKCHACGMTPCDDFHQFWGCPSLDGSIWPEVQATQKYVPKAAEEAALALSVA